MFCTSKSNWDFANYLVDSFAINPAYQANELQSDILRFFVRKNQNALLYRQKYAYECFDTCRGALRARLSLPIHIHVPISCPFRFVLVIGVTEMAM